MFTDKDLYRVAVRRLTGCSDTEADDMWFALSNRQKQWWTRMAALINDQFDDIRDSDAAS